MFSYRAIIRQGWEITRHGKYLWFFGLFAALLGNGGEYELLVRGLSGSVENSLWPGFKSLAETGLFSTQTIANLPRLFAGDPISVFLVLLFGFVLLALFGFLVWIVIVSQAALVNNAALAAGKKKHDLAAGISAGIKNFWPVLGLNLAGRVLIGVLFAVLALPWLLLVKNNASVGASFAYGFFFILLIPFAIAISFVIKYSIAYVVIRGENFVSALVAGWELFRRNWIVSIEMALILFLINFSVGLLLFFFFLIMAVPLLFLALAFHAAAAAAGFFLVALFSFALFFAAVAFVGAGLACFQISSWTVLFTELVRQGGTSKIARAFGRLLSK